jgi:hypothetical protein
MAFIRKTISNTDYITLLSLKSSDIDLKLLKKLLAFDDKNKRMLDPLDEMVLNKADLEKHNNELKDTIDSPLTTTVGRYLFNLFMFSEMRDKVPYFNKPIDKKYKGTINSFVDDLLKEKHITSEVYIDYINKMHWFSFSITSFIAYTLDLDIIKPLDSVRTKKNELFETNKKSIEKKDEKAIAKIETELLDLARNELESKNSTGIYVFNSGKLLPLKFFNC